MRGVLTDECNSIPGGMFLNRCPPSYGIMNDLLSAAFADMEKVLERIKSHWWLDHGGGGGG